MRDVAEVESASGPSVVSTRKQEHHSKEAKKADAKLWQSQVAAMPTLSSFSHVREEFLTPLSLENRVQVQLIPSFIAFFFPQDWWNDVMAIVIMGLIRLISD